LHHETRPGTQGRAGEDLGSRVAAELQRHRHGLPRAGRADDGCAADIAHMEAEPERDRAFRLAEEQWRPIEMRVGAPAGPHR